MSIEEGKPAPDFTLKDARGREVSLHDFRGRDVVVYFYPRDDTPGCTKEAQGFRDLWPEFQKLGVVVIGVSPDGPDSHERFAQRHGLPFLLLSDPEHEVMAAYGAWGEKTSYGRKTVGVIRSTVWIDPEGRVVKHWRRVARAADHPAKVLEAIASARGGARA